MKECELCKQKKDIEEFSIKKHNKDGRSNWCKDCSAIFNNSFLYNRDIIYKNQILFCNFILLNNQDINIYGIDIEKIKNTKIKVKDIPGIIDPIYFKLILFLEKYNLSFAEFIFILKKMEENSFYFI